MEEIKQCRYKYKSITAIGYNEIEVKKSQAIDLDKTDIIHSDFHRFCSNTQNKFDLVIGNLPYICYQYFDKQQQNYTD